MKFKVQNLGIIEEAEVDLSKDLILLCGQNNTGKTFLTYAIYGLLKDFKFENEHIDGLFEFTKHYIDSNDEKIGEVISKNEIRIDLEKYIDVNFDNLKVMIKNRLTHYFSNYILANIYPNYYFEQKTESNFNIEIEIDFLKKEIYSYELSDLMSSIYQSIFTGKESFISRFNKKENCLDLILEISENVWQDLDKIEDKADVLDETIGIYLDTFIIFSLFQKRLMLFTAERKAINLFSKELSIIKNKVFQTILKSNKNDLIDFARERINRYQKPIIDSLEIAEDLLNLSKNKSEFAYLAEELEKIMGGKVAVSEYGDLRYKPNNSKSQNLEMHLSSSLVKSLSSLAFYLRHLAQKNDVIMIDEPELNLHPDNQRKIARFFGRLVNEGFKVIISTHSDYIVKEINNLIMLSKESKHTKSLLKKFKYHENEIIKPSQVEALLFRQNSGKNGKVIPEKIEITETGLSVKTIDEVIDDLDNTIEAIYFKLFESDNDE